MMNWHGWEVQSWPGLFTGHWVMLTSLWLLVSHPWELRSQSYEPGVANLSQKKSQETGVWTVLHPLKPAASAPSVSSSSSASTPVPAAWRPQPVLLEHSYPQSAAEGDTGWPSQERPRLAPGAELPWSCMPDSPTVPRLLFFLSSLNGPMANVSHVSPLISILLKTRSGFSHLCKHKADISTQASLSYLPWCFFACPCKWLPLLYLVLDDIVKFSLYTAL